MFLAGSITQTHHHSLGSRCSGGPSWSSPGTDPSCWGKAQWRSLQRICGCRYCWIDGGTHACGSRTVKRGTELVQWPIIILYCTCDSHIGSCLCHLTTSSSSTSTMSYALSAPQKMMQVTPSKQWIHFFLSDLWPPTSNILVIKKSQSSQPLGIKTQSISACLCLVNVNKCHKFAICTVVTNLKCNSLQENCSSMIPVVLTRDRSTSCSVGI